ncbi:MAG: hypothetical protein BGN99_00205 [Alphaproteobacteria bacterium 65-37]|nr:AI-2E family transporter [Alphaproteobacteria bacterium]OJU40560.1 MAG: hypothetical protein BGN99_00205 [Alphaproteobacteria bacterium 65-37]
MKYLDFTTTTRNDSRLVHAAAVILIAAIVIAALYFGRDVLIPAAVAILFSFVLGPAVTWVRRGLPPPLAVAVVVLGAVLVAGAVTALFTTQLADVAGSLTAYQTNLQQKIKDIRGLAEGGGALSRFVAMVASLASDLAPAAGVVETPLRVQTGGSDLAAVAAFVGPLLHPLLTIGIVVILAVFILLDREHLSDQFVRLFGASDVHATSEAIGDASGRVARMLSLQLVTNIGFAVLVGVGLFALGLPNAALWGLMAGGLRFIPYLGTALGAVLPTLIAFAVMPGWAQPFLVLGWIVVSDIVVGQIVEPLLFGDSTGVTPIALIMSAIFWGTLWGPVGLLLSTPITICLLVLGTHVPQLGFLHILLGDKPALEPYQQIYRRLIRKAVADASSVALAEIETKGPEQGLDDSMGRMVVLAEADRARDRLSADQIEAIVEGTDEVLDILTDGSPADGLDEPAGVASSAGQDDDDTVFRCVGGRGQVDDAAAAIIAYALRRSGLAAESRRRGDIAAIVGDDGPMALDVICYASYPSNTVRRYAARKLALAGGSRARHVVIDYEVAATAARSSVDTARPDDVLAGDLVTLCRLMAQHAASIGRARKSCT